MNLLQSIAVVTALFTAGVALAANTQDDAICSDTGHTGYTVEDGTPLPDASTFNPAALPSGMTNEGSFRTNFNCLPEDETCHYVYIPATESQNAKWVECKGRILRN